MTKLLQYNTNLWCRWDPNDRDHTLSGTLQQAKHIIVT